LRKLLGLHLEIIYLYTFT